MLSWGPLNKGACRSSSLPGLALAAAALWHTMRTPVVRFSESATLCPLQWAASLAAIVGVGYIVNASLLSVTCLPGVHRHVADVCQA